MKTIAVSVIVFLVSCCVAWAQTGPLVSELCELRDIRCAIRSDEATEFAGFTGAGSSQAEAAAVLVDAARTEITRSVNRHLRSVRDDGLTLEKLRASEAEVVKSVRETERQLLLDLRALLDESQQGEFQRYEWAHRRSLLSTFGRGSAIPFDLVRFLRAAKVDVAGNADLAAVVAQYEKEGDRLLVAYARAQQASRVATREQYEGTTGTQEKSAAASREERQTWDALADFQTRILDKTVKLLEPTLGDRLLLAALSPTMSMFGRPLDPRGTPLVTEVLALDLSPAQRARVKELTQEAERKLLERARRFSREDAEFQGLSADAQQAARSKNDVPINRFITDVDPVQRQLNNDVLAVLTREQRLEYEARPVVGSSVVSPVVDGPEAAEWWR